MLDAVCVHDGLAGRADPRHHPLAHAVIGWVVFVVVLPREFVEVIPSLLSRHRLPDFAYAPQRSSRDSTQPGSSGPCSTFLCFRRWLSVLTTKYSPPVPTQMRWTYSFPEGSTVLVSHPIVTALRQPYRVQV